MNVENIRLVIETIRDEDNAFSMEDYGNPACGTAACICGWANHLLWKQDPSMPVYYDSHISAGKFLGIDELRLESTLFFAFDADGAAYMDSITRDEAITTLENLIETGKVDWSHAKSYVKREDRLNDCYEY